MTRAPFADTARQLHETLTANGGGLFDIRGEPHLETRLATSDSGDEDRTSGPGVESTITWLEPESPLAHIVPDWAPPSLVRFFLDGSQRTLPGYFVGSIPVVASIVAAAVLDRNGPDGPAIMPGMVSTRRVWIAPRRSGVQALQDFTRTAESLGIDVVDPLDGLEETAYQQALHDYPRLEQRAYAKARSMRADLETSLFHKWLDETAGSDDWIVVDGPLRKDADRSIGLVKSYSRQYLDGANAAALLQLPAGSRSSAIEVDDGWRQGRYRVWYLRMRTAQGRDPRHGLVRIETGSDVTTPGPDEISRWILNESRPSARSDERWATLLYPIHYLERILHRSLERETRGWPRGTG